MASLRIVANRPDPSLLQLPWATPLEEWTEHVVPLPRGLSRHVVRIVRVGDATYAVKETVDEMAFREYRLLRDLQRLGLPSVTAQGVVTGRLDENGEELPAALLTEHLQFSLPYRSLFAHGLTAANLPELIDAMVVLLVRLHLADFYWGDVVAVQRAVPARCRWVRGVPRRRRDRGAQAEPLGQPARVRRHGGTSRTSSRSCSTCGRATSAGMPRSSRTRSWR